MGGHSYKYPNCGKPWTLAAIFRATPYTMTREEIIDAIQKVEGISGMTVNERLFATGLMEEYDKSKHNDPQKAEYILEQLLVDKPSIDKILKLATIKRNITFIFLSAINIGLTMFLLSVLADNVMEYKKAIWVTLPIIFGLTYLFVKTISRQITAQQNNSNPQLYYATVVVSILNVLILALNYYCWIDLFDGATNTMFP